MTRQELEKAFKKYDNLDVLAHYVVVYCLDNDIEADTYAWDTLMSGLYYAYIGTATEFHIFENQVAKYLS